MNSESDPLRVLPAELSPGQSEDDRLTTRERSAVDSLGRALQAIKEVLCDELLVAGLLGRGFSASDFQEGVALQVAAEDVFATCQTSVSRHRSAAAAFNEAWVNAREEYLEFRSVVRSMRDSFPATDVRVSGTIERELLAFVNQATASYAAARDRRRAKALANRGFTAVRLIGLTRELANLVVLNHALVARQSMVDQQLDDRDMALAMLNVWVRGLLLQTRMVAGVTTRPPADAAAPHEHADAARVLPPRREVRPRKIPPTTGTGFPDRFKPLD